MLLNLSPLKIYREYRLLFLGQLVSDFGSMMTYVALPYQLYHLTNSSLAVGLVGVAQLVPLLFTALVGGAYADAWDKRKLLMGTEILSALCSLGFVLNSLSTHPSVWLIYFIAALNSGLSGFHNPAQRSMIPRVVERDDIPAVSSLNSLKDTLSAVAGPALGGILIAIAGLPFVYFADFLSFGAALITLLLMKPMPPNEESKPVGVKSIVEGLKYARNRQELLGTYVVDFVAVIFGMPMALFPAVAERYGGPAVVGLLYSAPSAGAFLASVFSGWVKNVNRHGAAVVISAILWGFSIIAFGLSTNLWVALVFLALAGGADAVSSIFRNTIWNETIPDHLRGRLAGVEMVSYMSGPLLGNAESGLVAALAGTPFSIISGGILCVLGVSICASRLPKFWSYERHASSNNSNDT
jgi:MFS family permease